MSHVLAQRGAPWSYDIRLITQSHKALRAGGVPVFTSSPVERRNCSISLYDIMYKRDVIRKPEAYNVPHRRQRRTEPRPFV